MTSSLKYIFIFVLMLTGPVFGQVKFLEICENPDPSTAYELNKLKSLFAVNTCKEIADKISTFQSYNEFFIPLMPVKSQFYYSWIKTHPLLGLKAKKVPGGKPSTLIGPGLLNIQSPFQKPELYKEFKNLKVLDITVGTFQKPLCELLKELPHIEIIMADMFRMDDLAACTPLSKLPDIVIRGDYILNSDLPEGIRKKIIGIEYLINFSRALISLPRLRYLGVSYPFKESDYRFLIQNQNITHLTLNSTTDLTHATVLGELPNLSFLALSCFKIPHVDVIGQIAGDSPEYCANADLKNVKFLKDLSFLEEIILDWQGLEDISTLDSLPSLKTRSHPFVP